MNSITKPVAEPQPSAPTAADIGPPDDVPLSLVHAKIAHARKRQKTDVNISDAGPFWKGYIAALLELSDYIDAQRLMKDAQLSVSPVQEEAR